VNAADGDGDTPLILARKGQHDEIVQALLDAGACEAPPPPPRTTTSSPPGGRHDPDPSAADGDGDEPEKSESAPAPAAATATAATSPSSEGHKAEPSAPPTALS
jgi:ankyrin repeat protein